MPDIEELMKRAEAARDAASQQLKESMEKSQKIAENIESDAEKAAEQQEVEEQSSANIDAANQQRQVEILGQLFSPETMAQMAANQELIQAEVARQVSNYAALGVVGMMDQLFGEDMGIISAALETLAMEEEDDEDEMQELDQAREEELYQVLENKLAWLDTLPESEPIQYTKEDPQWGRFGILLSGIISTVNDHELSGMDVEEHIPVLEQKIVSLVRRSWGINGRSELLDTIHYLSQEGYILRYQAYCEAETPEELAEEGIDEEELASISRGWRFVQHFKDRYGPNFLIGWDVGRAAMLARWGYYLGWITEGEAVGILWELSQKAAKGLHSWREFAQSYLFGGMMWKLLCGDGASAESYLGYLADAATDLLTGNSDMDEGQWRDCPWPETHKTEFNV